MAIKQLSINNEILDIDNIPKLNARNIFRQLQSNNTHCVPILISHPIMEHTKVPSESLFSQIWFLDKNDYWKSVIQFVDSTTSGNRLQLLVHHTDNVNEYPARLEVIVEEENTDPYRVQVPTVSLSNNSDTVATTNWVRKYLQSKGIS